MSAPAPRRRATWPPICSVFAVSGAVAGSKPAGSHCFTQSRTVCMSLRRATGLCGAGAVALLAALAVLGGCKDGADAAKAPPPIEVGVVKVSRQPVTVYDEYVAQAQ